MARPFHTIESVPCCKNFLKQSTRRLQLNLHVHTMHGCYILHVLSHHIHAPYTEKKMGAKMASLVEEKTAPLHKEAPIQNDSLMNSLVN